MQLGNDQAAAMSQIVHWMGDPSRWMFYLGGYAGTGKTTLVQYLINDMPHKPLCLAPTGKAATVLQSKLQNCTVSTVHSALYKPLGQSCAHLEHLLFLRSEPERAAKLGYNMMELDKEIKEEKERLANAKPEFVANEDAAIQEGELVVIDEASMVSDRMMEDLKRTGAKVLFVGDPGQLPPVNEKGYFSKNRPDFVLQEVHRQALDNPIIRLSMDIRKGNPIPSRINCNEIQRFCKLDFDTARFREYDQALAGTNHVRRKVNRMHRKMYNFHAPMPMAGEKLICLKNQFRFDHWFVNGIQFSAAGNAELNDQRLWYQMDVVYEGDLIEGLPFYPFNVAVHYDAKAEQEPWEHRKDLIELDYAYCITVHKSQGSEWPRVILIDDEMCRHDNGFRKRWLYTAVTRAKEHITWLTER